jgi:hypothetical protein
MRKTGQKMASFLLWCILFVLCWPLALLVLIMIPIVWLILLPFKILGAVIHGLIAFAVGLLTLPFRLICGRL